MSITRTINYTDEKAIPVLGSVETLHRMEEGKIIESRSAMLVERSIVKRYRRSAIQVARYGSQNIWSSPVDARLIYELSPQ